MMVGRGAGVRGTSVPGAVSALIAAVIVAVLVVLAPGPAAGAGGAVDFLTGGPWPSDSELRAQPARTPPGAGGEYVDEIFGTRIRQLTGSPGPGVGFVPEYSKAGAFNADGSRFLVRGTDGSTLLFDAPTMTLSGVLPLPEADLEPRWSPTDPNLITYLDNFGSGEIKQYSIATGQSSVLGSHLGFGQLSSGAEQDHSRSGRYYALHGTETYDGDGNWVSTPAFVADLATGSSGPVTTLTPPVPGDFLDYVAITPDDEHVLVMWALTGARLYTRDWSFVRQLTDWDEHADFCRSADGTDTLVIARYRPGPNDQVVEAIPLSGVGRRVLWQVPAFNLALHISCRNTDLPGWAFVSSYWDGIGQRPGPTPFENEVFALALDSTAGAPVLRRLAHTGMVERADYFDEPHATVSRDGRVVLFGSNFGRHRDSEAFADVFAVDLRAQSPGGSVTPSPSPVGADPAVGVDPTAGVAQSAAGIGARRLRRGNQVRLPALTDQGQELTWSSATPGTCRVRRSRAIGVRAGRCVLRARAPAIGPWLPFRSIHRIRVTR